MSNNPILHRLSQLVSLLLGARIFVLALFTFTLYVSTFFFFLTKKKVSENLFSIIKFTELFFAMLSIAAGGIINHFMTKKR